MSFDPPEDRWEPWPGRVELIDGPERIYDADPTPYEPRPVGFGVIPLPATPVTPHPESDPVTPDGPLTWDGDNS